LWGAAPTKQDTPIQIQAAGEPRASWQLRRPQRGTQADRQRGRGRRKEMEGEEEGESQVQKYDTGRKRKG